MRLLSVPGSLEIQSEALEPMTQFSDQAKRELEEIARRVLRPPVNQPARVEHNRTTPALFSIAKLDGPVWGLQFDVGSLAPDGFTRSQNATVHRFEGLELVATEIKYNVSMVDTGKIPAGSWVGISQEQQSGKWLILKTFEPGRVRVSEDSNDSQYLGGAFEFVSDQGEYCPLVIQAQVIVTEDGSELPEVLRPGTTTDKVRLFVDPATIPGYSGLKTQVLGHGITDIVGVKGSNCWQWFDVGSC